MRIATWNINGLRARLEFVLHWLRERQPDVVGLQELKLTDDQFPMAEFEAAGYQAAPYGQKSWNGVAVLSKKPIEVVQRGLPGQDEFGSRLITASIDDLSFTTIYLPNGKTVTHDDFPKKLDWIDSLLAHFESAHDAAENLILCGDFNLCPEAIDSWDEEGHAGHIFHTEEERSRYQKLLDWGFVDAYRALEPEKQEFSWWDYRGGAFHRGHGLRIDFVLASRSVMARAKSVEIDREYRKKKDGLTASDHCPVILEID